MIAANSITGDRIRTKAQTQAFDSGYDNIDWGASAREITPSCNCCTGTVTDESGQVVCQECGVTASE